MFKIKKGIYIMANNKVKTNVMRILDKEKIKYTAHEYDHSDGVIDGVGVANKLGQDVSCVFKTLVTKGNSKNYYVFVIPVAKELDLKKAAKSVNEKSVEMIHVKDILSVTGYIRGGCSPIGMKKKFTTVFDSSISSKETVMVSAGKIGYQIELSPEDLIKLANGTLADIAI